MREQRGLTLIETATALQQLSGEEGTGEVGSLRVQGSGLQAYVSGILLVHLAVYALVVPPPAHRR